MKINILKNKKKLNIQVHEHLEFVVKHTTYADRLRWLEEANEFVRAVEKARKIKNLQNRKF